MADFAAAVTQLDPDLLVLLGDRHDLLAPAACAVIHRLPLAHIAGGETTLGALDEQVRHSLTKAAHLHFCAARQYGWNVRRMGEEAWRVHVVGALGVENIRQGDYMAPAELKACFDLEPERPTLLVTFHPETLTGGSAPGRQVEELAAALSRRPDYQQVITFPGTETGYREVIAAWQDYAAGRPNVRLFKSLGSRGYLGLMRLCRAVVGNSSSGLVEAPSLAVPTLNIGDRQKGRLRAPSVIDAPAEREAIIAGLNRALRDEAFRRGLAAVPNPYDPHGDGQVSSRILKALAETPLDARLLEKRLDFPGPGERDQYGLSD